ncbi:MAG: acylphosphatase [Chromatocurvus sp.]
MVENRRYRVSGKVQLLSYRASTRQKAGNLGLNGWVRKGGEAE